MIKATRHPKIRALNKTSGDWHGVSLAIAISLCLVSPILFAEDGSAADARAAGNHLGFYYAFPAYLYDRYSASGVQFGYEQMNLHIRLDLSLASGYQDGEVFLFANPSLGAFYSQDWQYSIRTYQGIAFGWEKGILNSFQGQTFFVNFMMGAEWLVSKRKAVYLEIGSGVGILPRDGAFNGGTIIGGGLKGFF